MTYPPFPERPSLGALVEELDFTFGQVMQLAGVSTMQPNYWTAKAEIPTRGKKQRTYGADAVRTVIRIDPGAAPARGLEFTRSGDEGGPNLGVVTRQHVADPLIK